MDFIVQAKWIYLRLLWWGKGRDLAYVAHTQPLCELETHLKTFDIHTFIAALNFYVCVLRITNEQVSQLQIGKRCLLFITCWIERRTFGSLLHFLVRRSNWIYTWSRALFNRLSDMQECMKIIFQSLNTNAGRLLWPAFATDYEYTKLFTMFIMAFKNDVLTLQLTVSPLN